MGVTGAKFQNPVTVRIWARILDGPVSKVPAAQARGPELDLSRLPDVKSSHVGTCLQGSAAKTPGLLASWSSQTGALQV